MKYPRFLLCLLICLTVFPCFAQDKAPLVIPTPAEFMKITEPELAKMIFTISEGGTPSTQKHLTAFLKKQEYDAMMKTGKVSSAISFAVVTAMNAEKVPESRFKGATRAMVESLKEGSISLDSGDTVQFSEDFRKKYGMKIDVAPGKNVFLNSENITKRQSIWGFLSYGNKVNSLDMGLDYTVDYCFYLAMVLVKGRVYTLELAVPVKNSAEIKAVKNKIKAWAADFARKNGAT